ncbi:MAG: hypothetical protein VST71_01065 [Nitrospirota bacterium]|nr:hypothetical protein [Nitrospirota bacterium]
MATVRKDFDSYKVWYYSGHPYEALIYCYQGGHYVGRVVFFKEASPIPPNANYSSGPSIHYPLSRFNDIISILRYEKPLYLFLNLDNLIGIIATAQQEPVGEEES